MSRTAIILPGLLQGPEGDSLLRAFDWLSDLAAASEIVRNPALPESSTPELAYLALDPRTFDIRQGVLTVSAFRVDPPQGSVCFHVSVGSIDDAGRISPIDGSLSEDDRLSLRAALAALETRALTPVWGEETEHALVWEGGSTDNETTAFAVASGRSLTDVLPVGDGEPMLRRFIDDSVNLLSGSDANKSRRDEGRSPVNVLWPWGQGRWESFPNLAVRRGEPVDYVSHDLRLDGLTRLFGYSHVARIQIGRRLAPDYAAVLGRVQSRPVSVVVLGHLGEALDHERWDLAEEALRDLSEAVIRPLTVETDAVVSLTALNREGRGLTLLFRAKGSTEARYPFDERILDERGVAERSLWKSIEAVLRP